MGIVLIKNKSEKEIPYDFTHVELKKKQMKKEKETKRLNYIKHTAGHQRGGGGGWGRQVMG